MAHIKLRAVFTLMGKMWGTPLRATPLRASRQWDSGRRCEIQSGSDTVSREAGWAVQWASWRRWRCVRVLLNPRDNRTDSPRPCQGLDATRSKDPVCPRPTRPPPPDHVEPDPTFFAVPMPRHCGPSGPCIPGWAWSPPAHEAHPSLLRQGTATSPTCLLAVTMLA